ncbi:MAG TPA: hypothetical protein VFS49_12245 [Croceibacterium sp.]|nr:hypothetical protein [Croceibacterium sp.]
MKKTLSAVVLAAASLGLGGCQALFGPHAFASAPRAAEPAAADLAGYFDARIEAGRVHLARGRPTLAVTAFRQASYDPAHAALAYNGMGVAYAELGRADLARRYFALAVASDPADARFARNLARLDAAPVDAGQRVEMAESAAPRAGVRADAQGNAGLHRLSAREVEIRSSDATPGRTITTLSETPQGAIAADAGHAVRVAPSNARDSGKAGYPVRIALSDVTARAQSDYPIRIELPQGK